MNKIYNAYTERLEVFAEALIESDVSLKEIAEVLKEHFSQEELDVLVKQLSNSNTKNENT